MLKMWHARKNGKNAAHPKEWLKIVKMWRSRKNALKW